MKIVKGILTFFTLPCLAGADLSINSAASNGLTRSAAVSAHAITAEEPVPLPLSFNLPPVPDVNSGDTSYDLSKEDAGDFGISDFSIEMDVTGKGFPISQPGRTYGALFIRSGEAGAPCSGPSVFIFDNGNVLFRLRTDEGFTFESALLNPKEIITRHLVFSRTGMTLQATIDGTQYTRTITKDIDDIAVFKGAPLRFRGNHMNKNGQSLYMDVTDIIMSPPQGGAAMIDGYTFRGVGCCENDEGDLYDGNLLPSAKTDSECAAACEESYSSDEGFVGFDFKSRLDGHNCYCLTAMGSGNIISTEAYEWCENVVCYSYNEANPPTWSYIQEKEVVEPLVV